MTNRIRITSVVLLTISAVLTLGACSDDSPTGPSSPLLGTWILMESEGVDVSSLQMSYTFTETQVTLTAEEGCKMTANYSVSDGTMNTTLVSDECFNVPAGVRDTTEFSVSGDQLLLFSSGDTTVLRKGTPNSVYLKGSWTVETIDSEPLPSGSGMTLNFSLNMLTITGTGSIACSSSFTYFKDLPDAIYFTTLSDECYGTSLDDFSEGTYTVSSTSLTLMFNGMTIVANRE